jgi:hypothetical protein
MTLQTHATRSRSARPVLEGLETRELLSTRTLHAHAHAPHAEISAEKVRLPAHPPIVPQLSTATSFIASTVPANGDVNPYGVAFVPAGFPKGGPLHPGDILVSNFNSVANLQGTGTTIVDVAPNQTVTQFYQNAATPGLSTALGVLRRGFVIVGTVPSTDGTSATVGQGSLLILDRNGNIVANLTDPTLLNGPWDLTVKDQGSHAEIFVSNVLSGTVTRIKLNIPAHGTNIQITSAVQIASGYTHRGDPAAFEVGPTGLALDTRTDTLYVASTADNAVYAIPHATHTRFDNGTGSIIYQDNVHLHGPLGMTLTPGGNLIVANSDVINSDPNQPSELVEFTKHGQFVAQFSVDPAQGGSFGLALLPTRHPQFAAVDDVTSTLIVWPFLQ